MRFLSIPVRSAPRQDLAAVPQYVIDAPGGGGKVPINPDYILSQDADRIVIRNYEGRVFEYPEASDGTPLESAPAEIEEPEPV